MSARAAKPAAAEEPPDDSGIAVSPQLENVGWQNFHRPRPGRIQKLEVEGGPRQFAAIGSNDGFRRSRGSQEQVRTAGDLEIPAPVLDFDLQFPEGHPANPRNPMHLESRSPKFAQRLESVRPMLAKVFAATAEQEPECLAVELAFTLRSGVNPQFLMRRAVHD
jgi:hypothetical protein